MRNVKFLQAMMFQNQAISENKRNFELDKYEENRLKNYLMD